MASKHRTLHDLVLHQLRDLYAAERHVAKMLPKMAKAAASAAVRQALEKRQEDTAAHVDMLEAIFEQLDKKAHSIPCEAMHGLIDETKTLIDDYEDSPAIDAGLLAAAQAMDYYAVARYGALKLWASQLGLNGIVGPLDAVLVEAKRALEVWAALAGTMPIEEAAPVAERLTLKEAALVGIR